MGSRNQSRTNSILVVDDSPEALRSLSAVLKRGGFVPRPVTSGSAAIEAALLDPPDLVLLDLLLPRMSGLNVCRWFKQDARLSSLPIIFMSGLDGSVDKVAAFRAGGVDYITKPFQPQEVLARIRTHLKLRELQVELQLQNQQLLFKQQESQERLAALSRAARDAIIMLDSRGCIIHWNEAAETMFGFSQHEALGQPMHTLLAPARFQQAAAALFPGFYEQGAAAVTDRMLELSGTRKSGEEFPMELSLAVTRLQDEWCAVGIVRDITDRKRRDAAGRQSTARYRASFEGASVGQALTGLDGRVIEVNQALAAMLDYGTAEIEGLNIDQFIHPEDVAASRSLRELIRQGEDFVRRGEKRYLRRDGTILWADVSMAVLRFAEGEPSQVLTHVIDISARKRAEETLRLEMEERRRVEIDLRHFQKLEAIGRLAAGIAHEINTPIQYVGDSVHFLQEAFEGQRLVLEQYRRALHAPDAGDAAPRLAEVQAVEEEVDLEYLEQNVPGSFERCFDGISRVSTIVRAMKEFAHPDQCEKSPADLNHAIVNTLTIARNEYKYVAEVELDLGELPAVVCSLGDVNQVLLNLFVNAAHAIADVVGNSGEKGRISVRTRQDGDQVRIEIADTGAGVPEAIRDRIFEPFFTTKPVGQGTGQGLAIARAVVVEKHGGALSFSSAVGQGTTFTIQLPIQPPAGAASPETR